MEGSDYKNIIGMVYQMRLIIRQDVIDNITEDLSYTEIYLGGMINYEDSFFQGGTVEAYNFTDDEASSEIHFLAKPKD